VRRGRRSGLSAVSDSDVARPAHTSAMKTSAPLANLITLGARDFSSLRDFYRNLGWPQIIDDGQFAAFELRGIVLALFPITQLARDGNAEPEPGTGGIRFTIGMMVDAPTRSTG
jgi:uncharacterized protein